MDGQTTPTYNANGQDLRTYAKNVLTVSSASNITNIVFNLSSQGKRRLTELTPSTGSVTYNTEGDNWTVTWTGNAAEVSLTVGEKLPTELMELLKLDNSISQVSMSLYPM